MAYSFAGKSADEIIRDLERSEVQSEIGGGAYEIAAAAIQAAVARENRRLQIRLTALSLALAAVSIVQALVARASFIRSPARQSTTITPRNRTPSGLSPAARMTEMISSTVGGSAG